MVWRPPLVVGQNILSPAQFDVPADTVGQLLAKTEVSMKSNQVLILIVAIILGLPILACGGCMGGWLLLVPTSTEVNVESAASAVPQLNGYIQRDCKVFAQAAEGKVVGFLSRKDQVSVLDEKGPWSFLSRKDQVSVLDEKGPWLRLAHGDVLDVDELLIHVDPRSGYHIHRSVFSADFPKPLAPEGMKVVKQAVIGFSVWEDSVRASELYNSGDTEANSKFLASISLQGKTAGFEKGEVVFIDEAGFEATKVRKQGDTQAFWVMNTLLDR